MSMMTRENFTNFCFGLNQFRVYLQKFKQKPEKKKGKEKRKKKRAPGATEERPIAQLNRIPKWYPLPFVFSLTHRPHLSGHGGFFNLRPKLAPGDCAIPRFNPHNLFPISPPPRAYKNPSLLHTFPLENPSEIAPGCSQPEPPPRSHRRCLTTLPVSLVLLAPSDLHEHLSLSSAHLIDLFLILLAR
jgi:hypothetical protein